MMTRKAPDRRDGDSGGVLGNVCSGLGEEKP